MRVVVADDVTLFREGLALLLREAGCDVVGSAADPDALLRRVALDQPDVAIVDIRMPPTFTNEGLQAARQIRETHPGTAVLVLSQHLVPDYAWRLIRDVPRSAGYLLKERVSDIVVLVDALHRLSDGECVVDPTIVHRLLHRPGAARALDALSGRELEVLGLIAEGRSNVAVAERLIMSLKTVEAHVSGIMRKLGIPESPDDNRRVLVVLAYLRGSISEG